MKYIILLLIGACTVVSCSELGEKDEKVAVNGDIENMNDSDEEFRKFQRKLTTILNALMPEILKKVKDQDLRLSAITIARQLAREQSTELITKFIEEVKTMIATIPKNYKEKGLIDQIYEIYEKYAYHTPITTGQADQSIYYLSNKGLPNTLRDTEEDANRNGPIFKALRLFQVELVKATSRLFMIRIAMSRQDNSKKDLFIKEVDEIKTPKGNGIVDKIDEIFKRITSKGFKEVAAKNVSAIRLSSNTRCSDFYHCPDGNTCCSLERGEYGCCLHRNAVCCEDMTHCCPNGQTCSESGGCVRADGFKEVASEKVSAIRLSSEKTSVSGIPNILKDTKGDARFLPSRNGPILKCIPNILKDTKGDARFLPSRNGPILKSLRRFLDQLVTSSTRLLDITNAMSAETNAIKEQFLEEVKGIKRPLGNEVVDKIDEIFKRITSKVKNAKPPPTTIAFKRATNSCPPGLEVVTENCHTKCTCPDIEGDWKHEDCVDLCPPWTRLDCPAGKKQSSIEKKTQFPECTCPVPVCV